MKPKEGISVDGGCSGNPGQAYYRAVDIATGKELFRYDIGEATNNIAEFLAVCNAIHYRNTTSSNLTIYSDSVTAIAWVKNKKANSSYTNNYIAPRIKKAEEFLKDNKFEKIEKWHTRCSSIKKSAKKQNIFFDLTPLYLKELFELQENTCGITGDIILNTKGNISLDKKDPKLGYIKGNVQWTNRKSNMMKQDLSMEELIKWCEKVLSKNKIPADFGLK